MILVAEQASEPISPLIPVTVYQYITTIGKATLPRLPLSSIVPSYQRHLGNPTTTVGCGDLAR
jgi:hypothetical protein